MDTKALIPSEIIVVMRLLLLLFICNLEGKETTTLLIRKLRPVYMNQVQALLPQANVTNLSLLESKQRYERLANDKCGSLWF